MLELLYLLEALIPELKEVIGVIGFFMLIFGLAEAFFGYKLFNIMLAIAGFGVGAIVGIMVFFRSGNGIADSDAMRIYMLIGGIIGSVLAKIFHSLGVFLAVGAMGVFIFFLITQSSQVSLVFGVICGIAGVLLEKYAIIISTALSGGELSATGIWFIGLSNGENKSVQLIGLLIGICGIIFQLWMEKRKPTDETSTDSGTIGDWMEVAKYFIGAALHRLYQLIKNPKETWHNLTCKMESGEVNPALIAVSLLLLPIAAGIIFGSLFQSALFGLGVAAALYALLMLLHIRNCKAKISPDKYVQRFVWEKWLNIGMENSIFLVFIIFIAPLFQGLFIWAFFSTFLSQWLAFVFFLAGTAGIYIIFFRVLSGGASKEVIGSRLPENTDSGIRSNGTTAAENALRCPNCGTVLAADSAFCSECGSKVSENTAEEYVFCTECGTKLRDGAQFCHNCGTAKK